MQLILTICMKEISSSSGLMGKKNSSADIQFFATSRYIIPHGLELNHKPTNIARRFKRQKPPLHKKRGVQ